MTRAVVFLAAAMVAASLGLVAQDRSGAISNPNEDRSGDASRNITITGCLNTSTSGGYSLTDEHSTTYALSGNTENLSNHASQQIEVTGKQQLSSNVSSGTSTAPTIQVTSAKVIANHCGTDSSSQQNRESDSSATASVDDAVKNRQLPQTSTILPLLGLIGLGSLVAGFFARH
jgi:phospholipase C